MKISTRGSYYGDKRAETDYNGILFSEYDYLVDKTDWHFHENPYFMYVLDGELYDVNRKQSTICPAGSFLFHNWQEPHFNSKESKEARGFHIEFGKTWLKKNNLDIDLWEGSQLIRNPELHHLVAKLYAEFRCDDAFSMISIELLTAELCNGIDKEKVYIHHNNPKWLADLIQLVHYTKEPLNLSNLSTKLGVHPGHISRAMPKYFNTTLGDYIRQIKIKKALDILVTSNNLLSDIAYDLGFSDQSHFTRTFKSYIGMTPKQFRNKLKGC